MPAPQLSGMIAVLSICTRHRHANLIYVCVCVLNECRLSRNGDEQNEILTGSERVASDDVDANANNADTTNDNKPPSTNGPQSQECDLHEHHIAPFDATACRLSDDAPLEFQIADDQLSQQSGCDEDPLSDPLALEDCLQFVDVSPPQTTEITLVDMSMLTKATVADAATATTADETCGVEEGVRSDGSDSGLGQESTNSSLTPSDVTPNRPALVGKFGVLISSPILLLFLILFPVVCSGTFRM